jgi:hypothetical protein
VSFFVAFLFLWRLEGAQLVSVKVSALGLRELLRGDDSRLGTNVEALGAAGTTLYACVTTELFTLSKLGLITGVWGEGADVVL